VIAPASAADLPAMAQLMAASSLLQRYRVTEADASRSLQGAFHDADALLISREPSLNGLAWLSFAPRVLNGAAYLRLLLVAENARGVGIGSRLLAAAEGHARQTANHVYLLATTDNVDARRFYERHGYRHVGDLPGLVWPDLNEALYHKALRPYPQRVR
jgi:GNAT superfamily N-acetyltransferase